MIVLPVKGKRYYLDPTPPSGSEQLTPQWAVRLPMRSPLAPPRRTPESSSYLIELRALPTGREGLRDGEGRVDGASAFASTRDGGLDVLDGRRVIRGNQAVDRTATP